MQHKVNFIFLLLNKIRIKFMREQTRPLSIISFSLNFFFLPLLSHFDSTEFSSRLFFFLPFLLADCGCYVSILFPFHVFFFFVFFLLYFCSFEILQNTKWRTYSIVHQQEFKLNVITCSYWYSYSYVKNVLN